MAGSSRRHETSTATGFRAWEQSQRCRTHKWAAPVIVCPAASCTACGFDAGLPGRLPAFPARISNVLALLRNVRCLAVHHHSQHPLLLGVRGEARAANMWKTRVRRQLGSEQSIRTVAVKYLEPFCCKVVKTVRTGNWVMNSAGEECRWLFRGPLRSRPPAGRLGGRVWVHPLYCKICGQKNLQVVLL